VFDVETEAARHAAAARPPGLALPQA
jgi:hypothetical protein